MPGSTSVKDVIHTDTGNDDIEIGTGNLKLIYSGNEGKLSQYVNTRTSVSKLSFFSYIS